MTNRTDTEFMSVFAQGILPRAEWTHTAHLRMAFLTLRGETEIGAALVRVREGIQAYNVAQNNPDGYHETITVAFVRLVWDRLYRAPIADFATFQTEHADLFDPTVLLQYYSRPRLFSGEARVRFVMPDSAPLP